MATGSQVLRALWSDPAMRWSLLTFGVLRLATGVAALILVHAVPAPPPSWLFSRNPSGQTYTMALPADAPLAQVVEPWHRWDTAWYIKVAIQGYRPGDPAIVFPPLYPLLIRWTVLLCAGNYVLASLLTSNGFCLLAFLLLFKLVQQEWADDHLARRVLFCLAAFPSAYYLVAGYSEPIYLTFVLASFLMALHRRWGLTGAFVALATLTRLQGAVLSLPLGWMAYVQLHEPGARAVLRRVPVVAAGPLSAALYLLYLQLYRLGTLDAAYAQEWQLFTRWPWEVVRSYLERLVAGQTVPFENDNALALLFIVGVGLLVSFKIAFAYSLYVWGTLGLLLVRYHNGPQLEGMVRYALSMFPCFIGMGLALRRWWSLVPYLAWAADRQLLLLDRFTHWIWVA